MGAGVGLDVTLASVADDSPDDDDDAPKVDREAILSRRRLLIALATSGLIAPGTRVVAQGPSVCLSPPRPPPEFEPVYTLELAGAALTAEQRERIAAVAGRWTDQRIPTSLWVHAHLRDGASDAARRAALGRAEIVAAELHRHEVPASHVVSAATPPYWPRVGAPVRITARGVTLWVQRLS